MIPPETRGSPSFEQNYATGKAKWNFAASATPTVNDDVTLGYQAGSVWIKTGAPMRIFLCRSAADGAAVWEEAASSSAVDAVIGDIVTINSELTAHETRITALENP